LIKGAAVPVVRDYGDFMQDGKKYYYVNMDFLGKNLRELAKDEPGSKFSERTTYLLTIMILRSLKCVHDLGYVHRDLKPDNFLIGCTTATRSFVYIVDLGIADTYRDVYGKHKSDNKWAGNVCGTPYYMSPNAQEGSNQSRKDDLWSLSYMMMHLHTADLPWASVDKEVDRKEKDFRDVRSAAYLKLKKNPIEQVFKSMPQPFHEYMHKVSVMTFEEEPDYDGLISIFEEALR